MNTKFKVGDKVRCIKRTNRMSTGEEGVIIQRPLKDCWAPNVILVRVTSMGPNVNEEAPMWDSEIQLIETAQKPVTLHGRPVKEGDRVYYLPSELFVVVAKEYPQEPWTSLEDISKNPQDYAWDEPPVVDPRTVPPPLCFIDGLPVRVGSIMYSTYFDKAVVITGNHPTEPDYLLGSTPGNPSNAKGKKNLSWDFPNTPPAPKKVHQSRTRWYNIYEHDAGRTSYSTFNSEEEAKKHALPGCLGQGWFQYSFTGPVKQ